jgi:hypothetical protein
MTQICQNCKKEFQITEEDLQFYERINVPPPTWCPECRMIRRMIWRNEKTLYKRKCSATNKEIFSMFRQDAPVVVYDRDYWWSDNWDPMDYGKEYDFNKPFFEQFKELIQTVPWPSRSVNDIVNSDYCMNAGYVKNCYLAFDADMCENCYYCTNITSSKDCVDCMNVRFCELCYESVNLRNCYKGFFSSDCEQCNDIYFCHNCINCSNCIGCVNLKNKQYHIFNKPYSKEEYNNYLNKLFSDYNSIIDFKNKFEAFKLEFVSKYRHDRQTINCSGDYIYNSKNVLNSYMVSSSENCKYCQLIMTPSSKDCYDYTSWGWNAEQIYESCAVGLDGSRLKFCNICFSGSYDLEYCISCIGSNNLFGCIGLRNKEYCILNKQYSKEEYFELRKKIIEHMNAMPYVDKQGRVYKYGEFFPPEFSPFNYNETLAYQYFQFSKEEALNFGTGWTEREKRSYPITITKDKIPNNIESVDSNITKEIIECEHQGNCNHNCTSAFRITTDELMFYKRNKLPIPHLCPECRYFERAKKRNPIKLWHRKCECQGTYGQNPNNPNTYQNQTTHFHQNNPCPNEFETSYPPESPAIVYCEECYNQEVV